MPLTEPSRWIPSGRLLKFAAATPPVALLLFLAWSYVAWHVIPPGSLTDFAERREKALFWGSGLPFCLFGGGTFVIWVLVSARLVIGRHGWLAVLLAFYHIAFFLLMFLAGCLLTPTKVWFRGF